LSFAKRHGNRWNFVDELTSEYMKVLLVPIIVLLPLAGFAQAGLAFFSSGREVAVTTNFERKIWAEFRLNTKSYNNLLDDLEPPTPIGIPQVAGHWNMFSNRQVTMSLGLLIGFSPSNEFGVIAVPLGIRTAPFSKAPNFYLLGEFSPRYYNESSVTPYVSWGVRYLFLKEE